MEAKDKSLIQQEILRVYPGTDPEIDIDWNIVDISFKAGQESILFNASSADGFQVLCANCNLRKEMIKTRGIE